jgi:hypothetical protein
MGMFWLYLIPFVLCSWMGYTIILIVHHRSIGLYLFDAVTTYCVEIASHRHGCCVLQRCIDFSTGGHRQHLVSVIVANALVLSQDAYGHCTVCFSI